MNGLLLFALSLLLTFWTVEGLLVAMSYRSSLRTRDRRSLGNPL